MDDDDMDNHMEDSEKDREDELPLFARFLSSTAYSNGTTCYEKTTVSAREFWNSYKTWAKLNNFKMRQTSASFCAELLEFGQHKNSGFAMARNSKDQLMVTFVPADMFQCLQKHSLLDSNVL